jgi:20S proteasome alpha/beta subunit
MNLLNFLFSLLYLSILTKISFASSSATSVEAEASRMRGVGPDRFVSAAPLIVGAACADGVVLVAVHTAFSEEPLLLDEEKSSSDDKFQDLPREYRGPFRIYSIDNFGTSLACVGWRADGQILAKYCRRLAKAEMALFGAPRQQQSQYGNYLASETSSWMARTALSQRFRPLSCVGLLAACGETTNSGFLWLVDITGAYQIKAHAVGAGAASVNEKLIALDFSKLSQDNACQKIVEILSSTEGIPDGSRFEVAGVGGLDADKHKRRMKRKMTATLGQTK